MKSQSQNQANPSPNNNSHYCSKPPKNPINKIQGKQKPNLSQPKRTLNSSLQINLPKMNFSYNNSKDSCNSKPFSPNSRNPDRKQSTKKL
jgi:hypothetical protein